MEVEYYSSHHGKHAAAIRFFKGRQPFSQHDEMQSIFGVIEASFSREAQGKGAEPFVATLNPI